MLTQLNLLFARLNHLDLKGISLNFLVEDIHRYL
nr:MAG TPA: hypothetical protein [Caudoviricetes sp.]